MMNMQSMTVILFLPNVIGLCIALLIGISLNKRKMILIISIILVVIILAWVILYNCLK